MTNQSRALYLLWLPIALLCLVIPIKGQANAYYVYARNALAHEIDSLKAEYGDAVDASLEGYDHELVAPALKEARRKRSTAPVQAELAKEATEVKAQYGGNTQKIDLSLDGYDLGDLDDYEGSEDDEDSKPETEATPTKQKRSLSTVSASLAQEASSVKAEFKNQVDLSLDGYDVDALADDEDDGQDEDSADEEDLKTRDTGSADTDDILGHIYSRSTPLKNFEPVPNKAEFGGDVDFSLDGYDIDDIENEDEDDDAPTPRLTRRAEDEDDDDDDKDEGEPAADLSIPEPDKAAFPPGVDFSLNGYDSEELLRRDVDVDDEDDDDQYLTSRDNEVRKRDFPDDDDDDNDRYHDATGGEEDGTADETSEDDGESWYVGVKRWLSGSEQ